MRTLNVFPVMQTHRLFKIMPLALAVVALAGCETVEPMAEVETVIEGRITYRERMLLPPGVTITVGLEDVSLMDVPAKLIAETSFPAVGTPPYTFRLAYPAEEIVERRRYGMRVRIEHEGKLWFINDTYIDPFAQSNHESLDIVVRRVSGGHSNTTRPPASMPDASLTGTYWKAILIDEVATFVPEGQREIHMVLQGDGLARGNSGCNTFRGPFSTDKSTIKFDGLASTRMACAKGMEQEQRFLQALSASTGLQIEGDTLTLTDGQGTQRLYFEAIYLR